MPVKNLPHNQLEVLIVENLSTEEWPDTAILIKKLQTARKRGWLTKEELIEICYWKSPRAIWHIKSNTSPKIKSVTERAFKSRSEQIKMETLISLKGVSIPMASSILTLLHPKKYGVIDIRVWELLYQMDIMDTNKKGAGFSFNEWNSFLNILRQYAKHFNVTARDIERTLFNIHRKYQDGNLYTSSKKIGK